MFLPLHVTDQSSLTHVLDVDLRLAKCAVDFVHTGRTGVDPIPKSVVRALLFGKATATHDCGDVPNEVEVIS